MRVLLFGGTGMVGQACLLEALDDPDVSEVLAVGRRPVTQEHPKLRQLVRPDLFALRDDAADLGGFDTCLFPLGISSVGRSESDYRRITQDLTLGIAGLLAEISPGSAFVYVSGAGTDSSEHGRQMWARVKGETENALIRLPLDGYAVRPGIILPRRGVRSATGLYRRLYQLLTPLGALVKRIAPAAVIDSDQVGRAMLKLAKQRPRQRIWSSAELLALIGAR